MQRRVNERISVGLDGVEPSDFTLSTTQTIIASISDVVTEIAERAGESFGEFILRAWELGVDIVDAPLRAVHELQVVAPRIDFISLNTIAPFSADMITRVGQETIDQVSRSIRTSVALGESPSSLMRTLRADLMGKDSPWRRVSYRSEIVARTEISRVQSLATEARVRQARIEFPELESELRQIFVTVRRGPWPCRICEPYDQTIWDVDDPDKPVPPTDTHPNCRCFLAPYFPGISTPPTAPSDRQADASIVVESIVDCECCGGEH